ncbi:MAG: hypothetical protein JO205_07230 [Pseudolabrys sp.]|nr:hypothetical protein [Pseudolabrys sp.]
MQLKLQSMWASARAQAAAFHAPDDAVYDGVRDQIIRASATALGVVIVALIAVLMGFVN